MKAFIFPGQGAQYPGMGKELNGNSPLAREFFESANEMLGFRITDIMFDGSSEDLRKTRVTQPAIFLYSVVMAMTMEDMHPDMVAGHSLGEFSALVVNGSLTFGDGLMLVYRRALAMQKACDAEPSTMAAVIGLDDETVEQICAGIPEVVVPANYNCPGQIVISGTLAGVEKACGQSVLRGAKRAVPLVVDGAFHSPLMESAREELAEAIRGTHFSKPVCPVYQNINALAETDPDRIRENLIAQLTAPVRWTHTIQNMIMDGALCFTEIGPGKVLQSLVKKINRDVEATGVEN